MRIQCDSLKSATMLKRKEFKSSAANGLMATLVEMDIFNLHSKHAVDNMLSQSVREVFAKFDQSIEEQHLKLVEQRREFDERMKETGKYHESQLRKQENELLISRRWTIGTIITAGFSLAAYLSALIHFNH